MAAMPRRKPTDERRREIAAAAGALFAEQGVRATTVRHIAVRVGVLSGSLYHHFKTKNDIVHEIMRAYGEDLVARYERAAQPGGTTTRVTKPPTTCRWYMCPGVMREPTRPGSPK